MAKDNIAEFKNEAETENIIKINDTHDFLTHELQNYEDVKPIVTSTESSPLPLKHSEEIRETIIIKEDEEPAEATTAGKGKEKFSPKKRKSKEREEKKGILKGIFGISDKSQLPKDDAANVEKLSENEDPVKIRNDTSNFLEQEVQKFEDVKKVKESSPKPLKHSPVILETIVINNDEKLDESAVTEKTKERDSHKRQKSEEKEVRKGFLKGLFGKSEKLDVTKDNSAELKKEAGTVNIIKIKKDTNDFLAQELQNYEDVKQIMTSTESLPNRLKHSVTRETIIVKEDEKPAEDNTTEKDKKEYSPKKTKSKEMGEKKGFLKGIFGISDKSQLSKDDAANIENLSENEDPIKIRFDTSNFLEQEVQKFEDVKQIRNSTEIPLLLLKHSAVIRETIIIKEDEKPAEATTAGKGKENYPPKKGKLEEREEKKGILKGIFGTNDKSQLPKDDAVNVEKLHENEDPVKIRNYTSNFLEQEVQKFEDVKQVKKSSPKPLKHSPVILETIVIKDDKKLDESTVTGKTKEKDSPKRQKSEEKEVRKGFLKGLFGKSEKLDMAKDNIAEFKKEAETENIIKIKDTHDFLTHELQNYEDVKPIMTSTESSPLPLKHSKEIRETIIIKEDEEPVEATTAGKGKEKLSHKKRKSTEREEKKGILKEIFGTNDKSQLPKDDAANVEKLHENEDPVKIRNDTSYFLEQEVQKFEDVKLVKQSSPKPLKHSTVIHETIVIKNDEKLDESTVTGKTKEKDSPKRQKSEEKEVRKGFLKGLFGKSEKLDATKDNITELKKVAETENIIKIRKDTHDFLTIELQNYEDVKPIMTSTESSPLPLKHLEKIRETIVIKEDEEPAEATTAGKSKEKFSPKKRKSKEREEKKGILKGIFGISDKSQLPKDDVANVEKLPENEDPVKIRNDTSNFLEQEVQKFEDVKQVKKSSPEPLKHSPVIFETIVIKNDEKLDESTVTGKTKEKDSPKRQKSEEKEVRKGFLKGLFGKSEKLDMAKDNIAEFKKEAETENIIKIKDTHDFLTHELQNYEDVKPIVTSTESSRLPLKHSEEIRETIIIKEDEEPAEATTAGKSKEKFSPKKRKSKEREEKKGILKGIFGISDKSQLPKDDVANVEKLPENEDPVKIRNDTSNFLEQEVQKFEDVKQVKKSSPEPLKHSPVIFETIVIKIDEKPDESTVTGKTKEKDSPKRRKSEEKDVRKGFLKGLFGKSEKLDATKDNMAELKKEAESENIIKIKKDTNDFLAQELQNYEDVKPIMTSTESLPKRLKHSAVTHETIIVKENEKPAEDNTTEKDKEEYSHEKTKSTEREENKGILKRKLGISDKSQLPKDDAVNVEKLPENEYLGKIRNDTSNFLEQEVQKFEDVKQIRKSTEGSPLPLKHSEVIHETIIIKEEKKFAEDTTTRKEKYSPKKQKSKEKEAKKGFLKGLFKTSDTSYIPKYGAADLGKPSETEDFIKIRKNTFDFLEREVQNHEDMKQIKNGTEIIFAALEDSPVIQETKITKKDEEAVETAVMGNVKQKDSLKKQKSKETEYNKGFIKGLFGTSDKSQLPKDDTAGLEKSAENKKSITLKYDTHCFLEQEVKNYEDAKQVKKSSEISPIPLKHSKVIREKIIIKEDEKPVEAAITGEDKQKDTHIKQKSEDREIKKVFLRGILNTSETPELPKDDATGLEKLADFENSMKIRKYTFDFLEKELENYEDVKQVKKSTDSAKVEEKRSVKKENLEDEEVLKRINVKSDKHKKVNKEISNLESTVEVENVKIRNDTLEFLQQELQKYEDSRKNTKATESLTRSVTVIPESVIVKDVKEDNLEAQNEKKELLIQQKSEERDEKKGKLSGLFSRKAKSTDVDSEGRIKNVKVEEHFEQQENKGEKKSFIGGIFGKKNKNRKTSSETEIRISEEVVKHMIDSFDFIQQERVLYDNDSERLTCTKHAVALKSEGVSEKPASFNDKKTSKENKHKILGLFHRPLVKDELNKTSSTTKLSEEVIKSITDTSNFILTEVDNYEDNFYKTMSVATDVSVINDKKLQLASVDVIVEKTRNANSNVIFEPLKVTPKQSLSLKDDVLIDVLNLEKDVQTNLQTLKKELSTLHDIHDEPELHKGLNENNERGQIKDPNILPAEILDQINNSEQFLLNEVNLYEDGSIDKVTDLDEDVEQKSRGLFKLFGKKSKDSPKMSKKAKSKKKKEHSVSEERSPISCSKISTIDTAKDIKDAHLEIQSDIHQQQQESSFLSKFGEKVSEKVDDLKGSAKWSSSKGNTNLSDHILSDVVQEPEVTSYDVNTEKDKSKKKYKKSGNFFSKLGEKFSGKVEDVKGELDNKENSLKNIIVPDDTNQAVCKADENMEIEIKGINNTSPEFIRDVVNEFDKKLITDDEKYLNELKSDISEGTGGTKTIITEITVKTGDDLTKTVITKIHKYSNDVVTTTKETEHDDNTLKHSTISDTNSFIRNIKMDICRENSSASQKTLIDTLEDVSKDSVSQMTRAVSDNLGQNRLDEGNEKKISEANIDLSNLPTNEKTFSLIHEGSAMSKCYITSPTSVRRHSSQRIMYKTVNVVELSNMSNDELTDEPYIVTEPDEYISKQPKSEIIEEVVNVENNAIKKPLFHLESEEEENLEYSATKVSERRDSTKSNVFESLTETKLDNLLSDLSNNLQLAIDSSKTESVNYHSHTFISEAKDSKHEVEFIEQKLRDLDVALDSLEKVNTDKVLQTLPEDKKMEKKLRRVERKFEKMASQVMDKDIIDGRELNISTPEVEVIREKEFQNLVSQISTEEVSDFQKEYSQLLDDITFSKTEDGDSKTPDSQLDIQELPSGEIVYMGPVKLNKDNLVNKAGIEVDVIPIMKSPLASPKPRKKYKIIRPKSEMGFRKQEKFEDDRGSLPDLKSPHKTYLYNTILQMNPNTFLNNSNESMVSSIQSCENLMSRSLDSTESKGAIMTAVVNWLQKSSPFSSSDNIDHQSVTTSIPDTMDTSISIYDDFENSILEERSVKSEHVIPDILISEDTMKQVVKETPNNKLEISCGPLTDAASQLTTTETNKTPQPKPRSAKTPDKQLQFSQTNINTSEKQKSPVRDDLLDDPELLESYSDKKNFWENVSKEPLRKRMSMQEEIVIDKDIATKKRFSVHEFSILPIPKPRVMLQQSQSLSEEKEEVTQKAPITNRTLSLDSTASDSSGIVHTELTKISESDTSLQDDKVLTEYQASFLPPSEMRSKVKSLECEIKTSDKIDFEKTDSLDSEKAQKGSSQLIENAGYISDSEDVEHYISDSEIEDRVPQIRERQMSVFAPPVASSRKTMYERSASLPTEDLYEVSARSIKLRKQYYEEQIKKEMIEEQLVSEIEEDPSPERKTLFDKKEEASKIKEEETLNFENDWKLNVKCLTNQLEKSLVDEYKEDIDSKTEFKEVPVTEESTEEKSLVKSLAKDYEEQLGNVVAGQKIGQISKDLKGFVIDKHVSIKGKSNVDNVAETSLEDIMLNEACVENDNPEKSDSYPSILSDELFIKEDNTSKLDSMEVHVDKSEIEDSEKIMDVDTTDFETKSIDSLNTELSPKASSFNDDHIPEITVTLSGKQRRISEESDEYSDKLELAPAISPIPEIKKSEERIEGIVWEASIQSATSFDEKVSAIVSEKVHVSRLPEKISIEKSEKEDDISFKDESDLASDLLQERSDSLASDKIKSDSHSDIEKIILDSLHQQKVDPEEAKKIANSLIQEIELEIEKNENLTKQYQSRPIDFSQSQVSDYLRQLAETKGLDEREVELVESVLARRQRELNKLTRGDTQASSMEITDEDLRYSGAELDYSHVLEQQIDQLEAEKDNLSDYDSLEFEHHKHFKDKSEFIEKINEEHTTEIFSTKDIDDQKKSTTIKSTETIKGEKSVRKSKDIIFEEDETVSESVSEELEKIVSHVNVDIKDASFSSTQKGEELHSEICKIIADKDIVSKSSIENKEIFTNDKKQQILMTSTSDKDFSSLSGKYNSEMLYSNETGSNAIKLESVYDESCIRSHDSEQHQISEVKFAPDGTEVNIIQEVEKQHSETKSNIVAIDRMHVESKSVKDIFISETNGINLAEVIEVAKQPTEVIVHEIIKRTSSSDSKSSLESGKSPEEFGQKSDIYENKLNEKGIIVFRKSKSDAESSSSSSNLKQDRKSGIEFETYSSSGESHYHSFEIDSGKSRPCSSDVEGLIAAGSSEYESALTSQMISSKSQVTSTEYQTAVSSLSSKESMKSLDSESSGNLASIEVSDVSETLIPSTSDIDGDILDTNDHHLLEDDKPSSTEWITHGAPIRQSTELSDSELLPYPGMESMDLSEEEISDTKGVDVQSKMKRSYEMTFQPEPKILLPESPQCDATESDDKLGTSLDDGSVLSMSVSSTSSTAAVKTIIEMSKAEDASMTISGTSEQLSIDEVENIFRESRENLTQPLILNQTADISTSTPFTRTSQHIESVTLTTSTIDEDGIQSVSTQVTSQIPSASQSIAKEDSRKKGHRRQESNFVPSMIDMSVSSINEKTECEIAESNVSIFNLKENINDEKKDIDEKEDYSENEIKPSLKESVNIDSDLKSQNFSSPDAELPELNVKSSDIKEIPDPKLYEEAKDNLAKFTSETQGNVKELEQAENSSLVRSPDIFFETKKQIKELTDIYIPKQPLEKRDSHGKSSSTSSEKSSFDEAEAEAAFSMVAHISPAHKIKQICPILEDEDAEKHELETREKVQKEFEQRRALLKDQSPGFIPDIKVTQHMTPLIDRNFRYPDLELEAKEREIEASAPQTPASNSSKSSEETDQGREYVLEETHAVIPEEPEDKVTNESKSEIATVIETTLKEEESDKDTDSPNSDSFEMLEKPDLIDDFVVIEEVAKEAHEFDSEGKSVKIQHTTKRSSKPKHDEEVEEYLVKSAPTPLTRMTDIKYYPDGSSSDETGFEFEDSPPMNNKKTAGVSTKDGVISKEHIYEYDRELEANKKWIEQQFQGDHAAMIAAGYGYEMEFERGPLEDIKEEDITDFEASSRIGSLGSQKESGGSLGSVKDSYSSTPEYDVLAGRKYFTRSGEHDDISMSSLQEFENLEQAMSLEMKRYHGSQDSSSNGSYKNRYHSGRSGQGDDISVSSLKEFEGLEKACIAAHKIEVKVKEEEEMLAQIDEGPESVTSESDSCETISGTQKHATDSDEEDYEKRMFEIDEIIRQAQNNVERFTDLKEAEKTESLGRGDSVEEVSKVPDLDLDTPLVKSTIKIQWKENEDVMVTSTDSLDLQPDTSPHGSADSLDQKADGDIMTTSTDSIEMQAAKCKQENIMTDSIEIKEDKSYMVSSDSLELGAVSLNNAFISDSIDEDGSKIGAQDVSFSSTSRDCSSTRDEYVSDMRQDLVDSTESIDITSSTATHATYQYETDSVFSGSFTSGGSNTMVSSTDTVDPVQTKEFVDVSAAVRKVWFDDEALEGKQTEYVDDSLKPYVTEVIEPCEEDSFSHLIHRRVELPPEVRKITFSGSEADQKLKQFIQNFGEGEQIKETEEVDEFGNVHVKRVVQKRYIIRADESSDSNLSNQPSKMSESKKSQAVITKTLTDSQGSTTTFTQKFDIPQQSQITTITRASLTEANQQLSDQSEQGTTSKAPDNRRRQLRYDISVDDQTEVDPREHDWRFSLPQHAEAEGSGQQGGSQQQRIPDQHDLSNEMRELLKELEKESKQ